MNTAGEAAPLRTGARPRPSKLLSVKLLSALILTTVIVLSVLAFILMQANEPHSEGSEQSSGTLIVTLVNVIYLGSAEVDFELYLNGNLSAEGTIPAADSAVIERSLTWTGPQLNVLVHVVITSSPSQPGDRTVTLTPVETERVNIVLGV